MAQLHFSGDVLTHGDLEAVADGMLAITPRKERRSSRYLTRFEVAKVIGERAKQIAGGNIDLASSPVATSLLRKGGNEKRGTRLLEKRKKLEHDGAANAFVSVTPSRPQYKLGATPVLSAIDALQRSRGGAAGSSGGAAISPCFDADMDELELAPAVTAEASTPTAEGESALPGGGGPGRNSGAETLAIVQQAQNATSPFDRAVDPVMIAKYELVQRQIPFVIRRTWPSGYCERIPVRELEIDLQWLDLYLL